MDLRRKKQLLMLLKEFQRNKFERKSIVMVQSKRYLILQKGDRVKVINKDTGAQYQVSKDYFQKNKRKYDIAKGASKVKNKKFKPTAKPSSKSIKWGDSGVEFQVLEPEDSNVLDLGNYAYADAKTRKQYRDHVKQKYSDIVKYGTHLGQGNGDIKGGYAYKFYRVTKPGEKPKDIAIKFDLGNKGNGNELHALNMMLYDKERARNTPSAIGKKLGKMPDDIDSKQAEDYISKKYKRFVGSTYKGVNKNGDHLFFRPSTGGGQTIVVKDPKEAEALKKYSRQ